MRIPTSKESTHILPAVLIRRNHSCRPPWNTIHKTRWRITSALSLLRQGRLDEARGDMLVGAQLEAQQPHRFAIGSALERVQGCDRLMLEEFRRNARRDAATASLAQPVAGNAPISNPIIRAGEGGVLRERRVVPLEELLRPGGPQSVAVEPAGEAPVVPPQNQSQPSAAKAAEQPATPAAAAPKDPFADEPERPAPKPAPTPVIPPQENAKPANPPANPPAEQVLNPFGG